MLKCIVSSNNICNSNITGNINVVQAYTEGNCRKRYLLGSGKIFKICKFCKYLYYLYYYYLIQYV